MKANGRILAAATLCGGLLAGSAAAKTSTPAGWTDDYDAALRRAKAEKKLVVADFSGSDWCGWCKKLDKEVFGTDEFLAGATNKYVLLMVDSPSDKSLLSDKAKEQNPRLAKKYGIQGYPTVLVLDAKGEVVHQTGYRKGGPAKYLESLAEEIRLAPDVKKHIKPFEDELDGLFETIQSALSSEMRKLKAKAKSGEDEGKLVGQALRDTVMPKYLAAYERAIEKARGVEVPENMKARKEKVLASHEGIVGKIKKMAAK